MRTVYLAGPMRGYVDFNFPAFHAAAADLRTRGYRVISPAEHDEAMGFDPTTNSLEGFDMAASMRWDLIVVLRVASVVVLPGWESSSGVAMELSVARAIGTPILAYPDLTPLPPEPITLEAHRLVSGPRRAHYGHPTSDFSRTGRLWGAILGIPDVPAALVGLCMAAVKISREVNAPKRDNLVDLAGYAETVDLVRQREAEDNS